MLNKLLETLKCATLLWAYICSEMGLEDKLEGIRDTLSGADGSEESGEGDCGDVDESGPAYPCDADAAKPKPEFPIRDNDSTDTHPKGNTYYVKVKTELRTARETTDSLRDEWIANKKISDKTLARRNSLDEAIKAAEALEK